MFFTAVAVLAISTMAGCKANVSQSPDVSDNIRKSLDQAGLKDVSVSQDRDKGIERNLDAALIQNKMHKSVSFAVKNGVVTLTGEVNPDDQRAGAEKLTAAIPNVLQVVNDLQTKNWKATSAM